MTGFQQEEIKKCFSNLLSGVAKMHDAPCSSAMHFDTAIATLAEMCEWRPNSEELLEIIKDAQIACKITALQPKNLC